MKTITKSLYASFVLLFLFSFVFEGQAQKFKGNGNVLKQEREVDPFSRIDAGGAFEVIITKGEPQSVIIESDENLLDKIITEVNNGTLELSSKGLRNFSKLKTYITVPDLTEVYAHGASTVKGTNLFDSQKFIIEVSGAGEVFFEVSTGDLITELSGASELVLKGTAEYHKSVLSGASELKAYDLVTENTDIETSGASNANVHATNSLTANSSGASKIKYKEDPQLLNISEGSTKYKSGDGSITVYTDEWENKTKVRVGGMYVEVNEDDSVKIIVGNHEVFIDDNGNVKWNKTKKTRFNGHWGGVHMGINGYVNPDFSTTIPDEENFGFLDLRYERSLELRINMYEQNFNLIKNKFGMMTGIGFNWNNYFYRRNDVILVSDSSSIYGYYAKEGDANNDPIENRNYLKSKLMVWHLTVPVLFEYQTNRYARTNSFHITGGMEFGWRIRSHSKVKYDQSGKTKIRERADYHLSPFRFNAYAGIGWGVVNLYATYSLNTLFREGKGPELYPFTVGITLVGW